MKCSIIIGLFSNLTNEIAFLVIFIYDGVKYFGMINVTVFINNNVGNWSISHSIPKIGIIKSEAIYRSSLFIHFSDMITFVLLSMYVKSVCMTFVIKSHRLGKSEFIA